MDTIMNKPWTKEEIEIVSQMIEKGLSASEIGKTIGRSRNSVIGAAHRNKLKLMAKPSGPLNTAKPKVIRPPRGNHLRRIFLTTSEPKEPKHEAPPPPPPDKSNYVPFLERRHFQCKFIVEKRGETHICCGSPIDRKGWCAYHAAIVFRPFDNRPVIRGSNDQARKIRDAAKRIRGDL